MNAEIVEIVGCAQRQMLDAVWSANFQGRPDVAALYQEVADVIASVTESRLDTDTVWALIDTVEVAADSAAEGDWTELNDLDETVGYLVELVEVLGGEAREH